MYEGQKEAGSLIRGAGHALGNGTAAGMSTIAQQRTQSEMESEINRLGRALEAANMVMAQLADRLGPVLTSDRDEKVSNGAATPEALPASPLCQQVRDLAYVAERLTQGIARVTARLAV